ncbi:MAG: diphosphomevalonate decarboxylase [Polyangiaceae bacterium]|nr:diphosphomevalonate decarboxylase [Polyangiaceae bacterium]MCW5791674.1 diphosphomevalonate decarboxylase [Polyangiaceae bacterium]
MSVAVAHANIALIKYWGKADRALNLPAVPSLSLTLAGLRTRTEARLITGAEDAVTLDGRPAGGRPRARVIAMLDQLRARAGATSRLAITSHNEFPTAAGLASSASGFAALALAASHALGLELTRQQLSALARQASASAARSVFGGWAELLTGCEHASPIAPPEHLDVRMLVAVTRRGEKAIGSTEAMLHTAETSPYYDAWVSSAGALFTRGKSALLARDLPELGRAMEHSTLAMHASMLAADPGVLYFAPESLAVMHAVRELRGRGFSTFFTLDAGPHVKVLCPSVEAPAVAKELRALPAVLELLEAAPGPAAELLEAP